jgi:1-phosphofructokinase
MIYTCTLNPSIDYFVEVDEVKLGELNRVNRSSIFPGGKGINVSRVLKNLGTNSIALGFVGGFTGTFIKDSLSNEGISHRFIDLDETTRINIKIKSVEESEINGLGPTITEHKQEELYHQLSTYGSEDIVVLAGSLPPSVPSTFYRSIAELCNKHRIPFVVDTSGPALEEMLEYRPFLIKPNQHELGEIFNVTIGSIEDSSRYGRELIHKGARNVIVSMAGKGAVFINKDVTIYAQVPKGEVQNSVGAGDSTVAGFLASFAKNGDVIQAFQYGVAAGTATAFSKDLCTKDAVEHLLSQIQIQEM